MVTCDPEIAAKNKSISLVTIEHSLVQHFLALSQDRPAFDGVYAAIATDADPYILLTSHIRWQTIDGDPVEEEMLGVKIFIDGRVHRMEHEEVVKILTTPSFEPSKPSPYKRPHVMRAFDEAHRYLEDYIKKESAGRIAGGMTTVSAALFH